MQSFLPHPWAIESKEDVLPYFDELLSRPLESAESFADFLSDCSELESALSEDMAWRYIRMTCDTQNSEYERRYLAFVQDIQPHLAAYEDRLNRKIAESQWAQKLDDSAYRIYLRGIQGAIELFREENIDIQSQLATLAQEYSSLQGAMTVELGGETLTLQQASNRLMRTHRAEREEAWKAMSQRRLADAQALNDLFDKMVALRHQMALNAGFDNYRDYMFKALGRYDYTPSDCFAFHESVEKHVVPLHRALMEKRKAAMSLDELKPWDTSVDPEGRAPLEPFQGGEELLSKCLDILNRLDPYFHSCLETMREKGLLDLESRIGKAPGGYNYPLARTNMPFIFMNASGNLRDVETLLHEAGHAIHSFKMAPLALNGFKNTPSEVAELASMSMELISMGAWDAFFPDAESLNRAQLEQIEGVIATLPWIATVDCFQHWIYENPGHTAAERSEAWLSIQKRFGTGVVDHSGFEEALTHSWHKQLHIFEVPFYYIEYGIAQLGAIGVWMNHSQNPQLAIEQYKQFLELGYTQPIAELYQTAGVSFDFSPEHIQRLMEFTQGQWNLRQTK
ncbi:MAG: M3 family oligoendopeptidase [Bacteroidia bacterium]